MAVASLSSIYNVLSSAASHHPTSASIFSDGAMEAGDVVQLQRDGRNYTVQAQKASTVWKGNGFQTRIESTGNRVGESISRLSARKYGRGGSGIRNDQGLHSFVYDEYNRLLSAIEQTESIIYAFVQDTYGALRAGIDITNSSLMLYVDNKYSQMQSGIGMTASSLQLYVDNKYNELKSGIDLTSSSLSLYVDNRYNQLKSGIDLTSSSLSLYVDNKYNQLKSGIDLTSSSLSLYVDNKYNQMKSGIDATSSSLQLYVDNKYNQMKSGIDMTSSSLKLYVDNKYNQMKSGIAMTSSSLQLYVQNETTSAKIIARINGNGGSEALISADKISLSGNTTLSSKFGVTASGIWAKDSIYLGSSDSQNITLNASNGNITAQKYIVPNSQSIEFRGGGTNIVSLTYSNISTAIKSASVSNGTLTLTPFVGNAITFSKAVTLSGAWDGTTGLYSVTATSGTITGSAPSTKLRYASPSGNVSKSGKNVTRTFNIQYGPDDDHLYNTGFAPSITINASDVFDDGVSSVTMSSVACTSGALSSNSSTRSSLTIRGTASNSATKDQYYTLQKAVRDNVHYAEVTEGSGNSPKMIGRISVESYYTDGVSAGQSGTHVTGAWSTVSSASRTNKLTISKTTSGSTNSLEYVIAAGASISWDSTNKKYVATGQAKVDGTVHGSDATASSGVLSISFGNLQGSGASGYRVAYIKEGTTTRVTSGNITDYGDGYSAGNSTGYNTGFSEGNSAGQTTGYNNARISVTFSGTNNQTMSIAKVSTGSLNSISYTIGATSGISWDSTNKKYTATAQAKLDSTNRGSVSSSSSGALSIVFNNLQGSGASAYRTVSLKEGTTARITSGNLTDYGDGYSEGHTIGYNNAKMSGSWSGSTLSISKGTSGSTSLSYTVSAGVTFGYDTTNKCYNIYGTAYVDSTARASASGTTGMEAAEDGVLRAISRTVTFVGASQQSNYNSRINTITANGTYYSCAVGPDSYWGSYGHNGSWSSTYYAGNTRSFTVNVPTSTTIQGTRHTMQCTGSEQTYPGSTTKFYYFRLEGNYSFSAGNNYYFYR